MAKGTVNKVILVGNLGADPDVRYTPNGTAVANIRMATTERVPAGEGNWEERTEWHRVVAFGKTAENCGNYLSKGRKIYVEGRLRTSQWEDAQGVKRYTTEIVAQEIQFLGGRDDQPQQTQSTQAGMKTGADQSSFGPSFNEDLPPLPEGAPPEEDIPF